LIFGKLRMFIPSPMYTPLSSSFILVPLRRPLVHGLKGCSWISDEAYHLYLCISDKLYCILTPSNWKPSPCLHSQTTGSPERRELITLPNERRKGNRAQKRRGFRSQTSHVGAGEA
jgi:hypothetical protein